MNQESRPQHDESSEVAAREESAAARVAAPLPTRRRRWLRLVALLAAGVFVIGAVLVALAPMIVSTTVARQYVLGAVNSRIAGHVQWERLALSWFGPLELHDVTLLDPQQRPVAKVSVVRLDRGVWSLLRAPTTFGEIRVSAPDIALHLDAANHASLLEALAPRSPALAPDTSQPKAGMPAIQGTLIVERGRVLVESAAGARLETTDLDATFEVRSLNEIVAELRATVAGGPLSARLRVRNLFDAGDFSPARASGSVTLSSSVSLSPLADLAQPQLGLRGESQIELSAALDHGALTADLAATFEDVQTRGRNAEGAAPLNLKLNVRARTESDELTADVVLSGASANATAALRAPLDQPAARFDPDQLLDALLNGGAIDLPKFAATADARIDLPQLQRALPELFRLRPNEHVTAGTLTISQFRVQTGERPIAAGTIELRDVAARSAEREFQLSPVRVSFDAAIVPASGLLVNVAELESSFASVKVSGTPAELSAEVDANLARFRQDAEQFIDFGSLTMDGRLAGRVALRRAGSERYDVELKASGESLRYASGDAKLDLPRASLEQAGHVLLDGSRLTRLVADHVRLNLNDEIVATGQGWYAPDDSTFLADLDIERLAIEAASARFAAFGGDALRRHSGQFSGVLLLRHAERDGPFAGKLDLVARNLAVDGKPVVVLRQPAPSVVLASDAQPAPIVAAQQSAGDADDLRISGEFQADATWLAADVDLAGRIASGKARVRWPLGQSALPPAEPLLAALLSGQDVAIPDAAIEANASVDLAALLRAAPQIRANADAREIVGGRLEIPSLQLIGGKQARVSAELRIVDLVAVEQSREMRLSPVSVQFDAALAAGEGLVVRAATLNSGFAQMSAQGTSRELRAQVHGDLGQLERELTQFVDLGSLSLGGSFQGSLALNRASDERVNLQAELSGESLRFQSGADTIDIPRAFIRQVGYVELADNQVARLVAENAAADLNGEITASGSGWFDARSSGFEATATFQQLQLAAFEKRLGTLLPPEARRYGGAIAGELRLARENNAAPVTGDLRLAAQQLTLDGIALVAEGARLEASGLRLASDGGALEKVRLEASHLSVSGEKLRWQPGETVSLDGTLVVTADIGEALAIVARVARLDRTPALDGNLEFRARGSAADGVLTLTGEGHVADLAVGAADRKIPPQQVELNYDLRYDPPRGAVQIAALRLASGLLTAELDGRIEQLDGPILLGVQGRYDADLEPLLALVYELTPASADMLVVRGRSSSEFRLSGPLRTPGAQPPYRGLTAEMGVAWDTAAVYGMQLGPAKLAPSLRDGQVTLPLASMTANQGHANLSGVLDLRPQKPTLLVPGQLKLLDRVEVDEQLSQSLLSRINPVFYRVTRIEGRVTLATQDVVLPLDEAFKDTSHGHGRLDLSDLQMLPSGLLGELLTLGGLVPTQDLYPVQVSALDFEVRDGRIRYDNFTMTFAQLVDLRFYGSVGLDDSLDLVVSIPLRPAILKRLGIEGSLLDLSRLTPDLRIDIPIVGTRENPLLDLAKIDKTKLLQLLMPVNPVKPVERLFENLLPKKTDKQ